MKFPCWMLVLLEREVRLCIVVIVRDVLVVSDVRCRDERESREDET